MIAESDICEEKKIGWLNKEWLGSEKVDSEIKSNEVPFEPGLNDEKGKPPWNDLGEEPLKGQV